MNDSDRPNPLQDADDDGFRPVEKAVDAGASSTSSESSSKSGGSGSSKKSKKGPSTPKIDPDGEGAGKAPTISIDEKVAWRSAPVRTRVEARPRIASARLVRLPAYPKSDWLPVEAESKVANRK
ncbi:MAG: hypothetical protein ACM3U2_21080 [Deltaproteobacteria bacterium]